MTESSQRKICRLCLSQTSAYFSLIEDFEAVAMLEALTTMRVPVNDDISTIMCQKCEEDLRLAFSIQQNFLNAEKRFRENHASEITHNDANTVCVVVVDMENENEPLRESPENKFIEGKIEENLPENREIRISSTEKFTCDVCGAVRTSKAYLKLHKYRCHKRVKCTVCSKIMSAVKVKNHMEVHRNKGEMTDDASPPETFPCETCGKVKFSKEDLSRHVNGIHRTGTCHICHKEMRRASLARHIETHMGMLPTSEKYPCDVCGKIKLTKDSLYRHRNDVHVKGTCPICNKQFSKGSLKKHVELHQKTENQSSEKSEFKCDICGAIKLTKASLYKHKYDHGQVECPICGVVIGQSSLHQHIKRHNKTYTVCDLCGKSVNSQGLKSHIEHSHKNNAYKCQYCDAVYRQKQTLVAHEKKEHLGTADFVCDTCGKKFYKKVSLRRHIECTHLKLKPFICKVCNMGFYSSSLRTKHMRIHTGETPYKCEICDKSFRKKATLTKHLGAVHDVKEELVVECDACGKKFASKLGLEVHRRVH